MLSVVFSHGPFKTLLPFLFLAVIVVVASRFGNVAGILGTLASALVFSTFLFQPTLSPFVENAVARDHLIWMLLIGVILSDLLGAYAIPSTRNRDR